jgi:tetratricopeptide (TPR) repeat protein
MISRYVVGGILGAEMEFLNELSAWIFAQIFQLTGMKPGPELKTALELVGGAIAVLVPLWGAWRWLRGTDDSTRIKKLAAAQNRQAEEQRQAASEAKQRDDAQARLIEAQSHKVDQLLIDNAKVIAELKQTLATKEAASETPGHHPAPKSTSTHGLSRDLDAAIATLLAAGRADALADKSGAAAEAALDGLITERAKARARVAKDEAALWRQKGALAFLHDTQRALDAYTRATELDPGDAEGWNQLGRIQDRTGDLSAAERAFRRVLALGHERGDSSLTAVAGGNLGILLLTRGDLDGAEALIRQALCVDEALGQEEGMANQYGNLGIVLKTRGDLDGAEAMYRKSLKLNEALNRVEGTANQYGNLGIVRKMRGDLDDADTMFRKSLVLFETLGVQEGMAIAYGNLAEVFEARGDLDGAEEVCRKSLAIEEALGRKEGMASDYGNLGILLFKRGDLEGAEAMTRKSLALFELLGGKLGIASQLDNLGTLFEVRGDKSAACLNWSKSRDLFRTIGAVPQANDVEARMQDAGCSSVASPAPTAAFPEAGAP